MARRIAANVTEAAGAVAEALAVADTVSRAANQTGVLLISINDRAPQKVLTSNPVPMRECFLMIKAEPISANTLKISVPERLKADDFQQLRPQIDSLIQKQGKIRLLIDASNFGGWKNIAAFERHIGFVNNHHQKVERIAVIAGHDWQHWVIGTIRLFVHPEVRTYNKGEENKALLWLAG